MRPANKSYGMVVLLVASLLLASCGGNPQPGRTGNAVETRTLDPSQPETTQDAAELRIVPTASKLDVAQASTIEVRVENVADLYGLHFSLTFNPLVLQVQDYNVVQEGVQIAPGILPTPDFTVVNMVDNEQGTIEYAVTQLNPREPAQGDGIVAVIHFHSVGAGASPLTFAYAKLASPDGREVPVRADNVTLEINEPDSSQKLGGEF
jgi:hypothetical protein